MAVIAISERAGWVVARWAFRQFLADIKAAMPSDTEVERILKQAEALDGLHLNLMDQSQYLKVYSAVGAVAHAVANGAPIHECAHPLDAEGRRLYRAAMVDLLKLIEEQPTEDP